MTTTDECKIKIQKVAEYLRPKVDHRKNDLNFLNGIVKFCERVEKLPTPRLTSALHAFGGRNYEASNTAKTAKTLFKKSRRGKIFVQPEAVKRRKEVSGSKNARIKGMTVKNNPFKNKKTYR